MKAEIDSRTKRLLKKMESRKIDAVLVTADENVFYFSGFSGDSTQLLVTASGTFLFTDFRYAEQAERECEGIGVFETKASDRLAVIEEKIKATGIGVLGVEKENITLHFFEQCREALAVNAFENVSGDIALLRAVKSEAEIEKMAKAAKVSDAVYEAVLAKISPGMTETEIYADFSYLFNQQGCSLSFTPIIASGENSALPHAPITSRKLKSGDFLTLDFGCKREKYCTDCTRTIGIGSLANEQKKGYDRVKLAQETAFNAIKPGMTCGELDAVARKIIEDAGYGENFGHALGHGVGLGIHEFPKVAGGDKTVLVPGMVITIEPGIYIKNRFGVRIEDMCCVTETGAYSFNHIDKELHII